MCRRLRALFSAALSSRTSCRIRRVIEPDGAILQQFATYEDGCAVTAWAYFDISNPVVAWSVCRGQIVSASEFEPHFLSFFAARVLRDLPSGAGRLEFEHQLDELRSELHPACASRLQGIYAFLDRPTAVRAGKRWGFNERDLSEIAFHQGTEPCPRNASWLPDELEGDIGPWAVKYLSNDQHSPEWPITELLFHGRASILDMTLRARARDLVLEKWPDSHALLATATAAPILDSDCGLIMPFLHTGVGGELRVDYVMKDDFNDSAFLDELGKFWSGHPEFAPKTVMPEDVVRLPDLAREGFVVGGTA